MISRKANLITNDYVDTNVKVNNLENHILNGSIFSSDEITLEPNKAISSKQNVVILPFNISNEKIIIKFYTSPAENQTMDIFLYDAMLTAYIKGIFNSINVEDVNDTRILTFVANINYKTEFNIIGIYVKNTKEVPVTSRFEVIRDGVFDIKYNSISKIIPKIYFPKNAEYTEFMKKLYYVLSNAIYTVNDAYSQIDNIFQNMYFHNIMQYTKYNDNCVITKRYYLPEQSYTLTVYFALSKDLSESTTTSDPYKLDLYNSNEELITSYNFRNSGRQNVEYKIATQSLINSIEFVTYKDDIEDCYIYDTNSGYILMAGKNTKYYLKEYIEEVNN